jgi:hypothetical protein
MDGLAHMVARQAETTQLGQAGRDPFSSSSSLLNVDVVKVRRAGLFSKQTCDALAKRGQV